MSRYKAFVVLQGPYDWHPAPGKLKDACRRAAQACSSRDVSLRKLALQEAVKNTDLATQLVGMGSIAEVGLQLKISCTTSVFIYGCLSTKAI